MEYREELSIMPGDHAYKKFDNEIKEWESNGFNVLGIAGVGETENPLAIAGIDETDNPLEIPGVVQEKNMNPKDVDGPDDVDEGGLGSGRNPEGGGSSGSQPGPLISFGETIAKQLMDAKLKESCPCRKNH